MYVLVCPTITSYAVTAVAVIVPTPVNGIDFVICDLESCLFIYKKKMQGILAEVSKDGKFE